MPAALERLSELRARDVMTRHVVTLRVGDPLNMAARLLWEEEISGAPVVNEIDQPVGVISATDIVRTCYGVDQPAATEAVEEYMSPLVLSVSVDTPLISVARKMCQHHVHRLIVMDSKGRLCGLISSLDIVAALVYAAEEAEAAVEHE